MLRSNPEHSEGRDPSNYHNSKRRASGDRLLTLRREKQRYFSEKPKQDQRGSNRVSACMTGDAVRRSAKSRDRVPYMTDHSSALQSQKAVSAYLYVDLVIYIFENLCL